MSSSTPVGILVDLGDPQPQVPQKTTRKKKDKIPAAIKNIVWDNYFKTTTTGKCTCCNVEPISRANFDTGHIISEKNGGEVKIDNLKPICRLCNSSMGAMNMEEFQKKYGIKTEEPVSVPSVYEETVEPLFYSPNRINYTRATTISDIYRLDRQRKQQNEEYMCGYTDNALNSKMNYERDKAIERIGVEKITSFFKK